MKKLLFALLALSTNVFSQNTITTNAPVQTSLCAGGNIVVEYSSTGTFNIGCIFTAELSDASGSFTNPIVLGSMPLNTGIIAGSIPQGTAFGFGYRVRVVASNPYTVGSTSPNPPIIITSAAATATIFSNPSTEVCQGETVTLSVTPNSSYYWSTGETTQNIVVSENGTYSVTVTNFFTSCQVTSNPVLITVHPNPVVNLGPDIEICNGQNSTLNAGLGYTTYNWNNGSSGQYLIVNSSNNYSVMVTDSFGCTNMDTVSVVVHPNPTINLGNDTIFCGNSLFLSAGIGYNSYNWNNGLSFNPSLLVETSGSFFVSVLDSNNCSDSDTILVDLHNLPSINLGNDLSACGNSVILNAGSGFSSYSWNNNIGLNQYFPVTLSGTYYVKVIDQFGCNTTDTINVTMFPLPNVNLGLDVSLDTNSTLILDAGPNYVSYQWNTSQSTQTIQITGSNYPVGPLSFSVSVVDANGCFNSDQITVTIIQSQDINSVSIQNFEIFPVPFQDILNVISDQNLSKSIPVFVDMLGRYYYPEFFVDKTNMIINRGNLLSGYYMLFINNGKELFIAGKLFIN